MGQSPRKWPPGSAFPLAFKKENRSAAQKKDPKFREQDPRAAAGEAWPRAPQTLSLAGSDVHVWRIDLDGKPLSGESPARNLSEDEIARAGRFRFARDRDHFIAARAGLRAILSRYVGAAAGTLRFLYGPQGKPALELPGDDGRLEFNLAHSRGLALFAVTRAGALGIDLEWIRPDVANEGIAERFFAPAEVAALSAVAREERDLAFFRCWTRKEAYIKARGEGLSIPLSRFCVSLSPGVAPKLLSVEGEPAEVSRWTLHELDPGPGFAAALAVQGPLGRLAQWSWEAG